MFQLKINGGYNKSNIKEMVSEITLDSGNVYSIVGSTGSGKSQLIEDIESLSEGDGITRRKVEILNNSTFENNIAHLSQNMNFILDMTVLDFIDKRLQMQGNMSLKSNDIIQCVNSLCGEPIYNQQLLTQLSGGQSRALMITDIAYNSKANIILIDEIENAGINKIKAMEALINSEKLVLVITHDPLLALYGHKRIIMDNGGIAKIINRTKEEEHIMSMLYENHLKMEAMREKIRKGDTIENTKLH